MTQSKKYRSSIKSINPREKRRRKLKIEHRNEQLIILWRLILLSIIWAGLGALVIRNGWDPIDSREIIIKGSSSIKSNSIINASGLNFPLPLLAINPKELKSNLLKGLPINAVSIRRQILPPLLEVELRERQLIAFSKKRTRNGTEKGMVDIDGNWIPLRLANLINPPIRPIHIDGWMRSRKDTIAKILRNRFKMGSSLERIIFSPNGDLNLKTKNFKIIHFGSNTEILERQLKTLEYLGRKLPDSFRGQIGTSLDIRDPSKPELQLSRSNN